jgi:hypothetical protein
MSCSTSRHSVDNEQADDSLDRSVHLRHIDPLMVAGREYVPCPSCKAIHSGQLWSKGNAVGHWFGLVCPRCGAAIPRLWSITSLMVLAITAPLWWLPVRMSKQHYLRFERLRARKVVAAGIKKDTRHWLRIGLTWGLLTGSLFAIVLPLLVPSPADYLVAVGLHLVFGMPVWLIAGVLFGLITHLARRAR